jgi:6-phosphogluconolactonase
LDIAATIRAAIIAALLSMASTVSGGAATFVYVSNAEDGDIGMHTLQPDGSLRSGPRFKAESSVMPMAVSPDKRFLIAAVSSKSYKAYSYSIDPVSGALKLLGTDPLAQNLTYISFDRSGRFLLGASYGANLVSVNPIVRDGRVGAPLQVIPTARHAHSIRTDNTNRFVFAPHLGTDQVFQFRFDENSGRLTANTPPVLQLKQGTGPRHLVVSPDNRFVYVSNELSGTVTALALDANAGTLRELDSVSMLPPDTKLFPGMPRGADGTPGTNHPDNDVWAADLHVTPNGRFLYASERDHEHARRVPGGWRERKADLPRKHADGETAPRVRHRSHRPLPRRRRREIGHALVLRDRQREWRAQIDRALSRRQGRELGRDPGRGLG